MCISWWLGLLLVHASHALLSSTSYIHHKKKLVQAQACILHAFIPTVFWVVIHCNCAFIFSCLVIALHRKSVFLIERVQFFTVPRVIFPSSNTILLLMKSGLRKMLILMCTWILCNMEMKGKYSMVSLPRGELRVFGRRGLVHALNLCSDFLS